ncbi:MAG: DUF192 domain-containing protein [Gaiellales bacterium]
MLELVDRSTGAVAVPRVSVAPAFSARGARGLLGRDGIEADAGLLLSDPIGCIHTVGMRFAIDIVFLDRDLCVVGVARDVPPWRLRWCPRGRHQLELAAGSAAQRGLDCGRRLVLRARCEGDGGQRRAKSPHGTYLACDAAHSAAPVPCHSGRALPSVPPPAGSTSGIENHSGRRAQCARIC